MSERMFNLAPTDVEVTEPPLPVGIDPKTLEARRELTPFSQCPLGPGGYAFL